jgi:hypothetical protein
VHLYVGLSGLRRRCGKVSMMMGERKRERESERERGKERKLKREDSQHVVVF